MIRTRKSPASEIVGHGDFIMALTVEQMELIGAMMGMIKLGRSSYQEAAFEIIDMLEELTGDDDYTSYCLGAVEPILEVRDDEYNLLTTYDDNHVFEFVV